MNFFKTAFFDEEEASSSKNSEDVDKEATDGWDNEQEWAEQENSNSGGIWNFGGLVKALTSKSEEVIEAYRRDLDEFRTGLKKETETIREVASRAVKDFPNSLEVGASVAQESLESVGQVIDEFGSSVWRGTTDILAEGKELISKLDEEKENLSNDQVESSSSSSVYSNVGVQKYSRFESQLRAMQLDSNTYCREPEDGEDFEAWKSRFRLEEKAAEDVEVLCRENVFMEEVRSRLVPKIVDYETFWTRYFYRLHKLKQADEARADLVKRAIISQEDEDLSWEVDDEEESEAKEDNRTKDVKICSELGVKPKINEESGVSLVEVSQSDKNLAARQEIAEETVEKLDISEKAVRKHENAEEMVEETESSKNMAEKPKHGEFFAQKLKAEEEIGENLKVDAEIGGQTFAEVKTDPAESSKSSDFSVVSSKTSSSHDEDDLGWDEIEDLSCVDEKRLAVGGSPHRADIHKRINAVEDDEDLSWDVDDDDDNDVKS